MSEPHQTELKQLRSRQGRLRDIQETFATPQGQRTLQDLIKTHCIVSTFDADPHRMSYKNGQRDLVLMLAGAVHKPDKFASQINEILQTLEQENGE